MLVGLEMDEQRMSEAFHGWPALAGLAAHLGSGLLLGGAFFLGLWRNAQLLAAGGSPLKSSALMIGRYALLTGLLVVASLQGAGALLATFGGVMIARSLVLWRLRGVAR
jgi:F1F0 ATPase subunit 2